MTPETPPPERSPVAPARTRLVRLLEQTRLLTLLLVLLVASSVVRTLLTRETPREREVSAVYADTLDALTFTKLSYSARMQLDSFSVRSLAAHVPPPSSPSIDIKARGNRHESRHDRDQERLQSGFHHPAISIREASSSDSYAERALQGWRKLAAAKTARAAEWRRYGIALFLFHRAGGLDAFHHILTLTSRPGEVADARKMARRGLADPFGHGVTTLSPAVEVAFWETLYGTAPLEGKDVPVFRHTLQGLRLGWFENVALTQLYLRANNRPAAQRTARLAEASASQVSLVSNLSLFALTLGSFGWIMVAITALSMRWRQRANTPPVQALSPYANPASPAGYTAVSAPIAASPASRQEGFRIHGLFPYGLLLLTFLLYMTLQETISIPLALLFPLLKTDTWSGLIRLRFTLGLQLCFYIPVLSLPLRLFRWGVTFHPQTGKPLAFAELLSMLGFRTRSWLADANAGLRAYLLLSPALLLMGALSDKLFHSFHTPLNPADLEMLAARFPLDKFLVFFVAAVAAPIVEETMFRGLLYPALRGKLGVWGAAALSAAIFSGVHPTLPGGFLPIWAIGFALALLYERHGSLLPGIVLHGLHNGFITLTAFALFAR